MIFGTPLYRPADDGPAAEPLPYYVCPATDCEVEMFGETPAAAEANMVQHLEQWHPDEARHLTRPGRDARRSEIAGNIMLEVVAQLAELSDETSAMFDDEEHEQDRAFADDLRESLLAAVDQRFSDYLCDVGLGDS